MLGRYVHHTASFVTGRGFLLIWSWGALLWVWEVAVLLSRFMSAVLVVTFADTFYLYLTLKISILEREREGVCINDVCVCVCVSMTCACTCTCVTVYLLYRVGSFFPPWHWAPLAKLAQQACWAILPVFLLDKGFFVCLIWVLFIVFSNSSYFGH